MSNLILLSKFRETEIEIWRPIAGYPGYDISNLGGVRSWWGRSPVGGWQGGFARVRLETPRFLKVSKTYTGKNYRHHYPSVGLWADRKQKTFPVYTLVANAFLPRLVGTDQVNHKNGVKTDARLGNLEWTDDDGNHEHATIYGLHASGERHGLSRITANDVRRIRERVASGEMLTTVARDYGYTVAGVSSIVNRKTWKYVD